MFGGPRRRFAPVKEGDELDVKIEAVGEKGDGIAKKQGFVLFVPNTKSGDEVRVRVTRVLRNAGFAEVIGGSTGRKAEEKPAKKQEEEEVAELEEEAKEHDSEDFGEEAPEAEEVAEKADEGFEDAAGEEEPVDDSADDSDMKED
ncbi:TRAM domain-containing protein [Candidatus Woesearchaeota archaeon]|nr:TRAM domain-containing protein [Candidatus Woesearchaeota archaeon]